MKKFVSRSFLNTGKEETAFAAVSILPQFHYRTKDLSGMQAEIKIADCSRIVFLDFSIWENTNRKDVDKMIKDRRKKVSILRGMLDKMEEALDELELNWKAE